MINKLREAAEEFVRDYENGDLGDWKHYARAFRSALAKPMALIYQISMIKGSTEGAWIDVDVGEWRSAATYPEHYRRRVVAEVSHD